MTTNRIAAIVGGGALFILGLIIGAAISGGPGHGGVDLNPRPLPYEGSAATG